MSFAIKPSSILLNFDDVINGLHDVADKWNRREGEKKEQYLSSQGGET